MKSIFLAFGLFLLTSFQSKSADFSQLTHSKEAWRNQIVNQIEVPDFVRNNASANDYKAVVKILPNGSIHPESVYCSNLEIKNYVEEELARIKLNQDLPEQETRIFLVIKFKVF